MEEIVKQIKIKIERIKRKVREKESCSGKLEGTNIFWKFLVKLRKIYNKKIRKIQKKKMGIYLIEKYNAIFFPIAKVANSSIKIALKERTEIIEVKKNFAKNSKLFKFAFVRNPYSRLVSCYENKIKKTPLNNLEFKEGVRRHFLSYGITKNTTFKDFVKIVSHIPDKVSDTHFRSQYTLITDEEGRLIPDFIGKFENLNQDYKKVCEIMGIENPPKLSHINKTKKKKNYKEYYDKETKKLVQERYKKDFEMFKYPLKL